jgi:hypothetical protein
VESVGKLGGKKALPVSINVAGVECRSDARSAEAFGLVAFAG